MDHTLSQATRLANVSDALDDLQVMDSVRMSQVWTEAHGHYASRNGVSFLTAFEIALNIEQDDDADGADDTPTTPATTVSIFGPNLRDQSRGQLHVHATGCADIPKMARREPAYGDTAWSVDVRTRQDIANAIYSDHMAEDPEHADDVEYWLGDVHVFPCCGKLAS